MKGQWGLFYSIRYSPNQKTCTVVESQQTYYFRVGD
jgi:hypothetical protein